VQKLGFVRVSCTILEFERRFNITSGGQGVQKLGLVRIICTILEFGGRFRGVAV
jgi:hypothetical protein